MTEAITMAAPTTPPTAPAISDDDAGASAIAKSTTSCQTYGLINNNGFVPMRLAKPYIQTF